MVSVYIVTHILIFCKGAVLYPFRFLLLLNRSLNLPQQHLGNIAGCGPQDGSGIQGVEIHDTPKLIEGKVVTCVESAPCQEHVSHGISESITEDNHHVLVVQFFQKAVFPAIQQVREIILQIVVHGIASR